MSKREIDPFGPPGRAGAVRRGDAGGAALRRPVAAGRNRLAGLLFVPGIGLVAWIAANAYLLGREYFELAAMRFHSAAQARALRRQHAGFVFALRRDWSPCSSPSRSSTC